MPPLVALLLPHSALAPPPPGAAPEGVAARAARWAAVALEVLAGLAPGAALAVRRALMRAQALPDAVVRISVELTRDAPRLLLAAATPPAADFLWDYLSARFAAGPPLRPSAPPPLHPSAPPPLRPRKPRPAPRPQPQPGVARGCGLTTPRGVQRRRGGGRRSGGRWGRCAPRFPAR